MFVNLGHWLQTFLNGYVAAVIGKLSPFLPMIAVPWLTVYIAAYGFAAARGEAGEPFAVFTWKMVKMMGIIGVAYLGGVYMELVFDTATGLQDGMATTFIAGSAFDQSSPGTVWQALDTVNTKASVIVGQIWLEAGILRLDLVLASAIFSVATCIMLVVAAFVTLLAKVVMSFAAAIGPLAILCLMFKQSSKFFDAWLSTLLSAVVLCWFVFFSLGLTFFVADEIVKTLAQGHAFDPGADESALGALQGAMAYAIMTVMCAVVLYQAPSLASSLTGGAAIQSGATMAASFIAGRSSSGGGGGGGNTGGGSNSVSKGTGVPYAAGHAAGGAARAAYDRIARRRAG